MTLLLFLCLVGSIARDSLVSCLVVPLFVLSLAGFGFVASWRSVRRGKGRQLLIGMTISIAFIAVAGFCFGGLLLAWSGLPVETTTTWAYPMVLKQWSSVGLTSHFPHAIPSSAEHVRFSAEPGFLQGGAHIQLRMQLTSEEVSKIESQVQQKTSRAYAGGDFFDHHNRDNRNPPTTCFYTDDDPVEGFPEHYTLYVLQASDHGSGSWNHGQTAGVAVSKVANEVVYWADAW